MWRYSALLPTLGEGIVTMGEGFTPILTSTIKGVTVVFKLDYLNPTGSFKDRGASALISYLKALRVGRVAIDSSGNAGAAVAAYSSAAGMECWVYVPAAAPQAKKLQISLYGAHLVEVPGDRRRVRERCLEEVGDKVYASHMWSPLFIEGLKTVAFEYFEQVGGVPDVTVIPVGSGGLLLGIYKGFKELRALGLTDHEPRLLAVQTAGYTPVYDALHGPYPRTGGDAPLADGIAVPDPPRLNQVVAAIKETGGDVIVVDDEETCTALKALARRGLFVEPTSATAVAALDRAISDGLVEGGERVYIPLTGTGLKAVDKIRHLQAGWENPDRGPASNP